MRTGGPASADSAHTSMESAPLPVRLAENGLTADAGKKERLQGNSQAWGTPHHGDKPHAVRAQKRRGDSGTAQGIWRNRRDKPPLEGAALEPFQALFRVLARKRNRSAYLISYISLWEGDSFAESSKNTEKEVL